MKKANPVPPRRYPFDDPPPLTVEQRAEVRAILAKPVFQLALLHAAGSKPASLSARIGTGAKDAAVAQLAAASRLSEIAGWEMYEAALFNVARERLLRPQPVEHKFPAEGAIDYDPSSKFQK